MGRRRRGRPVNGILLLDKPSGWSSNQALQRVKWLYFAAKAGHTGSLDPLADIKTAGFTTSRGIT